MNIKIELIGNTTMVLVLDDEVKIGFDPMLAPFGKKYIYKGLKTSRKVGPVYNKSQFNGIKNWIVGHGHFDHIDLEGLNEVDNDARFIVESNVVNVLKKWNKEVDYKVLGWNDEFAFEVNGVEFNVRAVNAYHGNKFLARTMMGDVNGYIIKIKNDGVEKCIWYTGDTVYDENVINAVKNEKIDLTLAILGNAKSKFPNGPFTMSLGMLNDFVKKLSLDKNNILALHMNDFAHFEDDPSVVGKYYKVGVNGTTSEFDI